MLGDLFLAATGGGSAAVSASDLSGELKITPAGVTHLMNALEEGGYIQRKKDPADRRVVLISLTKKGTQAARALVKDAFKKTEKLADHLGEEDSQAFVRIMSVALEFFNEDALET